MKIAIDCSKAVNEVAGISKYTLNLAKNLLKLYPQDQFFLYFNFLRGAKKKTEEIREMVGNSKNVMTKIYPLPGTLKEFLFYSPFSISNYWINKCDIVHATEFLSFDNGLRIPQVLTVHDLTTIIFPEHRANPTETTRHNKMLKKSCQNAQVIISDSQATKNDIIKYFSVSEKKIKVVYLGVDHTFSKITDQKKISRNLHKYQINFPYILFVGTIEPRKNIISLIKAFDKFSYTNKDKKYHLILVGKKGWNTDEIYSVYERSLYKDRIIFLDYVANDDLLFLYNGASLFCYPSIYEGFGLPPLEAMACGVPVVTSNVSSLPEIVGEAAYKINPQNWQSLYLTISKLLSNYNLSQKMVELGFRQAEKFSWEKCAQQTHRVYQEIYANTQTKK